MENGDTQERALRERVEMRRIHAESEVGKRLARELVEGSTVESLAVVTYLLFHWTFCTETLPEPRWTGFAQELVTMLGERTGLDDDALQPDASLNYHFDQHSEMVDSIAGQIPAVRAERSAAARARAEAQVEQARATLTEAEKKLAALGTAEVAP